MPVVNAYKYLGIYFTTRLSFSTACREIASKAKKALLCIMQRLRMYDNYSVDVFLRLFDAQIQPILQYGSEIWGMEKAAHYCERIHLFGLKKFLAVDIRTPNDFVYKELNRYPITINSTVSCIRYWLKLIEMDYDRLPKKAYLMLCKLDERGKLTWATNVRMCLYRHGFGEVWMWQGVGRINEFLSVFKQRLTDCRWQNWNDHVQNSERFAMYKSFCNVDYSVPMYLQVNIHKHLKFIMTRFRFGVSDLVVHRHRYKSCNNAAANLICPLCKNDEENEVHFLLSCPFLEDLRKQFITPKFYESPNAFELCRLLSSDDIETVKNLCIYLYRAFKVRQSLFP